MTTILLIRHGESEANKNNIFAGHYNCELSERGFIQAKKTADFIAESYKIDKIYSSDLKRAFSTGSALADKLGMPIEKRLELREISAGKWDGMIFDEIKNVYSEDFNLWLHDIVNARCTDGESVGELYERVKTELNRIADENDGKTVAVATHATPIRAALTYILYGSLAEMNNAPWVSNASVTVIRKADGKWSVLETSLDEHLAELRTAFPKGATE